MIGKILVLAASLVGIGGFFLPLISAETPQGTFTASTFDIVQGLQTARSVADTAEDAGGVTMPDGQQLTIPPGASEALNQASGYMLIPWIPTALFLVFTLIGIGRFGRGLGVMSLLVGLAGVAFWVLLNSQWDQAVTSSSAQMGKGIGFTLNLVAAALGAGGGLLATIQPQQRKS